jgi:CRISPR-associated protein Cas1
MQLVLDTRGLKLLKKGGIFLVESEKSQRSISPAKLSSIAVTSDALISADAVKLAVANQIPILFFDFIGKAKARLWSPYFESIASLRRRQVYFSDQPEATSWLIDLFLLKTESQLDNLRYLKARSPRLSTGIEGSIKQIRQQSRQMEGFREQLLEECRQNLMGNEGSIARTYWQTLGNALPREYRFQKRSRRPAEDHFNAALNYLYGMLYSVVEGGVFAAGLDPYLGFLHVDEYKKPTLVYDLIEPIRPWTDRLLIEAALKKEIKKSYFTKNQHGIFLNKNGKAWIIPLFNDFLRSERPWLQRESTVRNHIYYLAGRLAQRIQSMGLG